MTTPFPPDRSRHSERGTISVSVFGKTDVGRTRDHNEDSFVVADLSTGNATLQPEVRQHLAGPRGSLFMIADGMGGAAAGEIASAMAIQVVLEEMQRMWVEGVDRSPEAFGRALVHSTSMANTKINSYAVGHPEFRGMGTTATVAGMLGDTIYLAQVGDSRGYLVRDSVGVQITKDQSLMQKLVEAGELTEEEAEHSERRNIILQALGPEPVIKVDLTHQQLRKGDRLVLCSDGLTTQIGRDVVTAIVSAEAELTNACKKLIDAANANGGTDNITVIVVHFDGDGLQDADESDEVRHRVFSVDESHKAMGIVKVGDENVTTQPIPATGPYARPSGVVSGEVVTAKADPAVALAAAVATNAADVVADDEELGEAGSGNEEYEEEGEEDADSRQSTGRLITIGLLVVLVLGAIWVAWTKFGAPSKTP